MDPIETLSNKIFSIWIVSILWSEFKVGASNNDFYCYVRKCALESAIAFLLLYYGISRKTKAKPDKQ